MNNLEWYKEELAEYIAEFGICDVANKYRNVRCSETYGCKHCIRDTLNWFLEEHSDSNKAHERKTVDARPFTPSGAFKTEKLENGTAFLQKPDSDTWVAKEHDSGTRLMSPNKFLEITFGVKKVIVNGPATIIFWEDGDKTVSICDKDDEFDIEKGIGMCFMKKALGGSYTNVIDALSRVADADNGYLSNEYIRKIDDYLRADMSMMNWLYYFSDMMNLQNLFSDASVNDENTKVKVENSDDTSAEK